MPSNPIFRSVSQWFSRHFSDPEALGLFFTLLFSLLCLEFFGQLLMPILVAAVVAYMLEPPVRLLMRCRLPRGLCATVVFCVVLTSVVFLFIFLLPLLWKQSVNLIKAAPSGWQQAQAVIGSWIVKHPHFLSDQAWSHLSQFVQSKAAQWGQVVLSHSLSGLGGLVQLALYAILVPLLVLFFLMDGARITTWLGRFLPGHRTLIHTVWGEVNERMARYIQGRALEIMIVSVVTATTFYALNLQYALLLGACVGVSVIVPYVGATVVTVPVVLTALMQWGLSAHCAYLCVAYAVIIVLDGNVLVPLLFSETMNLHPVAIILSVIIFGGIWGFWGIFFAIPLATICHAVLAAWPSLQKKE